jgi:hypothetical protein
MVRTRKVYRILIRKPLDDPFLGRSRRTWGDEVKRMLDRL